MTNDYSDEHDNYEGAVKLATQAGSEVHIWNTRDDPPCAAIICAIEGKQESIAIPIEWADRMINEGWIWKKEKGTQGLTTYESAAF